MGGVDTLCESVQESPAVNNSTALQGRVYTESGPLPIPAPVLCTEPAGSRKENVMKQETVPEQVTVPPTPTPNKAKQRETTYAGKLGDWQRILTTLAANAADLPHLE